MKKKDAPKKKTIKQGPHLPPPETVPGILNKLVKMSVKIVKKIFK